MIVWSKDMKIKKSHLRQIIREELQRESRFRDEDAARDHQAVYGYGHGDKLSARESKRGKLHPIAPQNQLGLDGLCCRKGVEQDVWTS